MSEVVIMTGLKAFPTSALVSLESKAVLPPSEDSVVRKIVRAIAPQLTLAYLHTRV